MGLRLSREPKVRVTLASHPGVEEIRVFRANEAVRTEILIMVGFAQRDKGTAGKICRSQFVAVSWSGSPLKVCAASVS
jgi:hypothetical protein